MNAKPEINDVEMTEEEIEAILKKAYEIQGPLSSLSPQFGSLYDADLC